MKNLYLIFFKKTKCLMDELYRLISFDKIVMLFGIIAFILIFLQFLLRDGLWGDELALASNFINSSLKDMLQPLKYGQVAPIGFLLIEKSLFSLFENSNLTDWGMRIYPLLCGIGVIVLYYPMVRNMTGSKIIALFSYILLIFNPVFIYYTSEVKQYICELFYCVLTVYFWLKYKNWTFKRSLIFIGLIFLGIMNSHVMCFILFPLGLLDGWILFKNNQYNVLKLFKDKRAKLYIFQYSICLMLFIEYYFIFLWNHSNYDLMHNYWKDNFFCLSNAYDIYHGVFQYAYQNVPFPLFIIGGILLLFAKKRQAIFIVFSVILLQSILSYFKLYPIFERLVLFWLFFIPILLAECIYFIEEISFALLKKIRLRFSAKELIQNMVGIFLILFYLLPRINIPSYAFIGVFYPKEEFRFINKYYTNNELIFVNDYWGLQNFYSLRYYTTASESSIITTDSNKTIDDFLSNPELTERLKYDKKYKGFWLVFLTQISIEKIEEKVNDMLKREKLPLKINSCTSLKRSIVCFLNESP